MVHHRFDLEAVDGADGIRRASGGGGTGGGIDRMSRALQIPPTEVFEIITQHRCGFAGLCCGCLWENIALQLGQVLGALVQRFFKFWSRLKVALKTDDKCAAT